MSDSTSSPKPAQGDKSTRFIVIGAVMAAAGVFLSVGDAPGLGSWLTVGGFALGIWSLHRFGRSGPE